MTDLKKKRKGPGYRSLYIGLFSTIVVGILLAVLVWGAIVLPSTYAIRRYFVTDAMQAQRRSEYVESLQGFVTDRRITMATSGEIAEWVRLNPCVYLLVYQSPEGDDTYFGDSIAPGAKDRLSEYSGSRIGESLHRDELIAEARSHGYNKIDLTDGSVVVAISEYTENLYYAAFSLISMIAAGLTLVLVLVRYIRIIIKRIKRFESDVTIVSEMDMNYEIISDGRDEIATLSGKVETMRQTMLDHIRSEQEAREANTELITSISHDLRTPLTVLMGYIEMMKDRGGSDETMMSYIEATENTALRLKQLSDDMFKYSLAFGDTKKSVRLEEYDVITLIDQLLAEHILLMSEQGYELRLETVGSRISEGSRVLTDPTNLMRIVDNVFSNMSKYADKEYPVTLSMGVVDSRLTLESKNKIRRDTEGAESNGIGLKTCVRLGSLIANKFEYQNDGEFFTCRLVIDIKERSGEEKERDD